jgi:AMP-binding enzyme C-terminal domain
MAKTRLGATRCGRRSAARTAKLADGCKDYVNIYPPECENLRITHPKVADAAVFGVPNEDLGEKVNAAIQLIPGIAPGRPSQTS